MGKGKSYFLLSHIILLLVMVGCKTVPKTNHIEHGTYLGDLKEGHPHGYGQMKFDISDLGIATYQGTWYKGTPHGQGALTLLNGDKYVGELNHGHREGRGTLYRHNTEIFEGTWEADTLSGYGILTDSLAKYYGIWNSFSIDSALVRYQNGDRYNGYLDSLYREDGKGTKFYADGSTFEGYRSE